MPLLGRGGAVIRRLLLGILGLAIGAWGAAALWFDGPDWRPLAAVLAVLEVRSLDIPFILEDGQIVGRLVYDRLTEIPDQLYGERIGSHYQAQGLKLSKHFKQD